jgi:hypothetical protein
MIPQLSTATTLTLEREPGRPGHRTGQIIDVDETGATVSIEIDGVTRQAAVAVSCLVRPMPGDLALVFCEIPRTFVLSVLERPGANWSVIGLPGNGNMSIEGETLSIAVRQRMSLRADTIDLQTKLFAVLADRATWIGKLYTLIADRIRSSSRTEETSTDTLTVKAVERIAIVDGVDSLQANTQVVKIAGIATETAHSRVIAVTDDLRLDGKRVTVA